ncbi:hypothetical protein DPMN_146942 [Dreissena polymorpha]|uniref:Uncharacterized protein n=1 Tax=Dreissena polymorpha TaxID=45954 RepID=A0A9D4F7G3_DREPO|nr:hypothetical protein DPMN_146942 [Dreissena polymorpha]
MFLNEASRCDCHSKNLMDSPCQTRDGECCDPTVMMIVRLKQCLALSLHHSPTTSISEHQTASQEQTLCGLLAWC